MHAMNRRSASICLGFGLLGAAFAQAQQRKPGDTPLRIGVERLLAECGFADALRRRFATDTGLDARAEAGPSSALLEALGRGEIDAAITHAPALEARLAAEGLAQDAHVVARGDFVLAGPGGAVEAGDAHDAVRALTRIAEAHQPFVTRGDGSGTHLAEQALWRAAAIAPAAPWYRALQEQGGPLLVQARAAAACCLIDRSSWLAGSGGARGLRLLVEGDPLLATEFRVQRSFRATHHAGRLFVAWLRGPTGRALVARTRGLRAPA
jgi:tungstate transport system substrate-binding protein